MVCAVALSSLTRVPTLVLAQSDENFSSEDATASLKLTAIPARLGDADYSLKGKPGEIIQASVQVKNTSSEEQQVRTLVENFVVSEDGEKPIPTAEEHRWNLARWITLQPSTQTIAPGEIGTVDLFITVPEDAVPGGRYAMVMHSPTVSQDSANGSGTGISQRVGTLVYFMVEGEIHQEAYIKQVEVKDFFEFGPVPFSFVIENQSDIHLHPNIQVTMNNMRGQQVDDFIIEPKNIFPGESRAFDGQWDRVWGFGKYTATISASYGTVGKVALAEFSFWMIPLRVILGGVLGVITFIVSLIQLKRKIHHEQEVFTEQQKQLDQKVNPPKKVSSEFDHLRDEFN
jgi:hypothetical protein